VEHPVIMPEFRHGRCGRHRGFGLPGFDLEKPPRATSLAQMTTLIADIADAVSPARPVQLLLHDWGCVFGYEFAAARAERVARIVSVDIGDYDSDDRAAARCSKTRIVLSVGLRHPYRLSGESGCCFPCALFRRR
jgi:pimeloyl-ACP methyl ester carboxylesterase